jgi:hypothetical protein
MAITALRHVGLSPDALNQMIAFRMESLDCHDRFADGVACLDAAGADRGTVQMNCAGAAQPFATAEPWFR